MNNCNLKIAANPIYPKQNPDSIICVVYPRMPHYIKFKKPYKTYPSEPSKKPPKFLNLSMYTDYSMKGKTEYNLNILNIHN